MAFRYVPFVPKTRPLVISRLCGGSPAAENGGSATKTAENVDEAPETTAPATKTHQNVDEAPDTAAPATKNAENVDGPGSTLKKRLQGCGKMSKFALLLH